MRRGGPADHERLGRRGLRTIADRAKWRRGCRRRRVRSGEFDATACIRLAGRALDWYRHLAFKHGVRTEQFIHVGGQVDKTSHGDPLHPDDLPDPDRGGRQAHRYRPARVRRHAGRYRQAHRVLRAGRRRGGRGMVRRGGRRRVPGQRARRAALRAGARAGAAAMACAPRHAGRDRGGGDAGRVRPVPRTGLRVPRRRSGPAGTVQPRVALRRPCLRRRPERGGAATRRPG